MKLLPRRSGDRPRRVTLGDLSLHVECQRQLTEGIPGARLLRVDEAGHSPQDEMPAQMMPVLRSFLEGAPVSRPAAQPTGRHRQLVPPGRE